MPGGGKAGRTWSAANLCATTATSPSYRTFFPLSLAFNGELGLRGVSVLTRSGPTKFCASSKMFLRMQF